MTRPKAAIDAWAEAAYDAIEWCATRHRRFTADAVWKRLEDQGIETTEGRALGPVMLTAKRHGLIENTGVFQRSKIRRQHGRPVPVWKSLTSQTP